jgi:hypothetical protein
MITYHGHPASVLDLQRAYRRVLSRLHHPLPVFTLPKARQTNERVPKLSIHQVRAQLLLRGMSIKSWAESRGYSRFSICHAMAGRRIGPKHRHMLELLQKDTGL